jgi:hypothetical protein
MAFIEDIVLGSQSMHPDGVSGDNTLRDYSKWVKDKSFHMGTIAPRVGGIKVYETSEDEVVMEVPLIWGGNMKVSSTKCEKCGLRVCMNSFRIFMIRLEDM